jgi:hypothetical protein
MSLYVDASHVVVPVFLRATLALKACPACGEDGLMLVTMHEAWLADGVGVVTVAVAVGLFVPSVADSVYVVVDVGYTAAVPLAVYTYPTAGFMLTDKQ